MAVAVSRAANPTRRAAGGVESVIGGGVLGEGATSILPTSNGVVGRNCKLPQPGQRFLKCILRPLGGTFALG